MQPTDITPELTQMNRYWFMLAAILNELDVALNHGDHTPEERLAKVRAVYNHMQSHMPPAAPLSVAQAAQAREKERSVPQRNTFILSPSTILRLHVTLSPHRLAPRRRTPPLLRRVPSDRLQCAPNMLCYNISAFFVLIITYMGIIGNWIWARSLDTDCVVHTNR